MSYKIRETDAFNVRERYLYHTRKYPPKGTPRKKRENPTSSAMKDLNIAHAIEKLYFKLCANFTHKDWYVTVKYGGDRGKTVSGKEMKNDMRKFVRELRKVYRQNGAELKFVKCFGCSENQFRHFHLVVNGIDKDVLQDCWDKVATNPGRLFSEHLWENFDYRGLAEYFIKNGQEAIAFDPDNFSQLYSCSRNLIQPVVKKKVVKDFNTFYKKAQLKADEGYEIEDSSIVSDYDCYGFKYLKYLMIKKE